MTNPNNTARAVGKLHLIMEKFGDRMSRVPWKEGKVISIEARPGLYTLGQMLVFPYMLFFNEFSTSPKWADVDLSETTPLFLNGVVQQFISKSNVSYQKQIAPISVEYPTHWVSPGFDPVIREVWEGTPLQMKVGYIGEHLSLIERDVTNPRDTPRRILATIDRNDVETIDEHEVTALGSHPYLNERLYLCHLLGRNVDVLKDIMFHRPLPIEYETWIRHLAHVQPELIRNDFVDAQSGLFSELKVGRKLL